MHIFILESEEVHWCRVYSAHNSKGSGDFFGMVKTKENM